MIAEFKSVYAGAWRYSLACPLLFAVPVVAEFVQHGIEIRIGMYDGIAGLKAAESSGARLGWGLVKTLSLTLAGYWVARFLLMPEGAAAARRVDAVAVRLYAWVMLWGLAQAALALWGGDAMRAAGLGAVATAGSIALGLATFVLNIMLAPWIVGAAVGNPDLSFVRSLQLVGWSVWWGLIFCIATILPPMALHYGFVLPAIGASPALLWAIMAVDAILVGYLGAIIAATNVAIARRAAAKSGVALVPEP